MEKNPKLIQNNKYIQGNAAALDTLSLAGIREAPSINNQQDYGTFVLDVLKLSSKLPISSLLSDDTIRVTHEFVTPRYLATSAPV